MEVDTICMEASRVLESNNKRNDDGKIGEDQKNGSGANNKCRLTE